MDITTMETKRAFSDANGHRRYHVWVVCPTCNRGRWIRQDSQKRKVYTRQCLKCNIGGWSAKHKGENSPVWRGGKYQGSQGYIYIYLNSDDFFYPMASKRGYVQEHRLIMAKHLNRCLLPWEIVHHKNGIKNDNRQENLELLPSRQYHIVDSNIKSLIRALEKNIERQHRTIDRLNKRILELECDNNYRRTTLNPKTA